MNGLGYLKYSGADLAENLVLLKVAFKKKAVPAALQEIVINCLNDFIKKESCSTEQLTYLKAFQAALINFCNEVTGISFNELLMQHLLFLRFNYPAFISFYWSRIEEGLGHIFELREQFEYLCAYEKTLKVQMEWGNGLFEKNAPAARAAVLAYVKAEIKHLQKRRSWDLENHRQQFNDPPDPVYRVKVSVSVDALAYLLRLLIESGVLIARPRSQLINFVAHHFQTPGIGEQLISAGSLGVKYLQVVQTTAKGVRAALMRMLKIVDTQFSLT